MPPVNSLLYLGTIAASARLVADCQQDRELVCARFFHKRIACASLRRDAEQVLPVGQGRHLDDDLRCCVSHDQGHLDRCLIGPVGRKIDAYRRIIALNQQIRSGDNGRRIRRDLLVDKLGGRVGKIVHHRTGRSHAEVGRQLFQ